MDLVLSYVLEFFRFLVIVGGSLYVLFKFVLKKFIETEIELSASKKIEDYKQELSVRDKSALVADLLSLWLYSGEEYDPEVRRKINKLSFEAFLWLPKEITDDISNLLSKKDENINARDIVVKVRQYLLGDSEKIESHTVIIFPKKYD